jgi:hypothetical protein
MSERCTNRTVAGAARQYRGALALLVASAMALSACATMGTETAETDAGAPAAQAAGPATEGEAAQAAGGAKPARGRAEPGWRERVGFLSPLATIGYVPLKLLPCSIGAVGSLFAFLFTLDTRLVSQTTTLNCGGDWVITPGMVEGREPFRSVGRVEDQRGPTAAPPSPAPAAIPPMHDPGMD